MVLNVLRVLARRWYAVLVGLLLTVGLAAGVMLTTPTEFTSRALILLLPSDEAVGEGGNPFLVLDGLEQPASLVTAYFTSSAAEDEVAQRSETASYQVALDAQVRGPVILVEVTDQTPAQSLELRDYLVERIPEELRRLQDEVGATESSIIGSMVLTKDAEAAEDNGAMVRLVIAALAAGFVGTGFLAFGIDGILARRSLRDGQFGSAEAKPEQPLPEPNASEGARHTLPVGNQAEVVRERGQSHRAERARAHPRARSR